MQEARQILVLENFSIRIYDENDYKINSADNIYDYSKFFLNGDKEGLSSMVGIKVFEGDKLISDCLIGAEGGGTGVHMNSSLISHGGVVICCADSVFKLSIPELHPEWATKADMATCFEIFYLGEDYIVHGEIDITRLDKDGKIVWQKSGEDIFTTVDGNDTFEITDEFIIATDWKYNRYKFDYDGNLVEFSSRQ